MTRHTEISIDSYHYSLPETSIAKHPLPHREDSRLLVCHEGRIEHRRFRDLPGELPGDSWMVFNNTRVIQARLAFHKTTGARIEVFCLEPVDPVDHHQSFESMQSCTWRCMVGNAKKWKSGNISMSAMVGGAEVVVDACMLEAGENSFVVQFQWDAPACSFSEIIESAGSTPIPPYLNRSAELLDRQRYQTIYSRDLGSVAAPTAGLHFTVGMMKKLHDKGIMTSELTLHVGAGTFVPVKKQNPREHTMHAELVMVSLDFIEDWSAQQTLPLAVGTTSTRSLETIYWLGVKLLTGESLHPEGTEFRQWDNESLPDDISLKESLEALISYCREQKLTQLRFTTSLMIVPGYRFRAIGGLITNFHLPGSTLLLLIAALIGEDWRVVYQSALENGYRFLSYGDSSLLLPRK
ncbi:MAG: S-adenosylmethionine:tRNA ribosyltransferase-isomerase [Bacteroidetes bacterium]|nr:S-adenosylmethionine:tRNA ribosyltransferase-isomerase [Bacteroidota bacterium]